MKIEIINIRLVNCRILPWVWWESEVWKCLESYTFKPMYWCFNFGIRVGWLHKNIGVRLTFDFKRWYKISNENNSNKKP